MSSLVWNGQNPATAWLNMPARWGKTLYVEENDPASPREAFVPGSSKTDRRLWTAAPSRYQACIDFLGYPNYLKIGTSTPGQPPYINRVLPHQYTGIGGVAQYTPGKAPPFGATPTPFNCVLNPVYPLLYAVEANSVEQVQPNNADIDALGLGNALPDGDVARYTFAIMRLQYQRRIFAIWADAGLVPLNTPLNLPYQVYVLNMNGATGGTFRLNWTGGGPTANIAYNATANTIQQAINPGVVVARPVPSMIVTGPPGGPFTIVVPSQSFPLTVIDNTVGGAGVVCVNNLFYPDEGLLLRWVSRAPTASARALTLPGGLISWVPVGGNVAGNPETLPKAGAFTGQAVKIKEGIVVPDPEQSLTITWHEIPLPAIPWSSIYASIGALNLYPLDPTNINAPTGTVMYEGPQFQVDEHPVLGLVAHIRHAFKIRYNYDPITNVPRGWNWGRRVVNGQLVMRQFAAYDTTGFIQGNPPFRYADHNNLFRPA